MNIYRLTTWVVLLILTSQSYIAVVVKTQQMQSCSFQGIEIHRCLLEAQNSVFFNSCCEVLQQALVVGHDCLCSLLSSSGFPLINTPLLLSFSSCAITVPPLTNCQDPIPTPHGPDILGPPVVESPPVITPLPVINQPPASIVPPVLIPPETLKGLPESTPPNCSCLPLAPTEDDVPLSSNPNQNLPETQTSERESSSSNRGIIERFWFHPGLIPVVVVHSFFIN